ncbi:MAG: hypothetical protein AAGF68_09775 [Pseudomonadota bacterium]
MMRSHRQKDFVIGIRQFGGAKARPLSAFEGRPAISNGTWDRPLVLIGDKGTRSARAHERGARSFGGDTAAPTDMNGADWAVTEEALLAGVDRMLPRVTSLVAYRFAWSSYLGAELELYDG